MAVASLAFVILEILLLALNVLQAFSAPHELPLFSSLLCFDHITAAPTNAGKGKHGEIFIVMELFISMYTEIKDFEVT